MNKVLIMLIKITSWLMALLLLASLCYGLGSSDVGKNGKNGRSGLNLTDLNNDNAIDSYDAFIVLRISKGNSGFSEDIIKKADANKDGKVDKEDAGYYLAYSAKQMLLEKKGEVKQEQVMKEINVLRKMLIGFDVSLLFDNENVLLRISRVKQAFVIAIRDGKIKSIDDAGSANITMNMLMSYELFEELKQYEDPGGAFFDAVKAGKIVIKGNTASSKLKMGFVNTGIKAYSAIS